MTLKNLFVDGVLIVLACNDFPEISWLLFVSRYRNRTIVMRLLHFAYFLWCEVKLFNVILKTIHKLRRSDICWHILGKMILYTHSGITDWIVRSLRLEFIFLEGIFVKCVFLHFSGFDGMKLQGFFNVFHVLTLIWG